MSTDNNDGIMDLDLVIGFLLQFPIPICHLKCICQCLRGIAESCSVFVWWLSSLDPILVYIKSIMLLFGISTL